jgi:hypothetical protein
MSIPRKTFPIAQVDDVARAALPTDTAYRAVDFIETYTGRAFYPLAPNIEGLTILDIAHALSNQCRYSGHVRFFFPTAQHCCLLAEWLVNRGGSALDALQILMHDAPEAYLVDVPRPIKQFMPQYRIWDFKINNVIREWMGWKFLPIPSFQDELDSRVIVDERAALFSASGLDWGHKLEPLGVRIEPWSPEHAEKQFLLQYAAYSHAVEGAHQYINYTWNLPVKIMHASGSDMNKPADLLEVDVRGSVGRMRVRDDDGIILRDPTGGMPRTQWAWQHGKFEVRDRA